MNKEKRFSENISDFCNVVKDAQSNYLWYTDEINRLDKLTQDYLHILELEDLDYYERAKIATKLKKCRQERRVAKDIVEVTEPFVEFFDTDKGRYAMNQIREILGKTRKIEKHMENRTYTYKVYKGDD